jgi:hypothetical protein
MIEELSNTACKDRENLTPEQELLVQAARIHLDDRAGSRLKELLVTNLDWGRILSDADHFGLQPLLLRHLHAGNLAAKMPVAVKNVLEGKTRTAAIRSLTISAQIRRILETMHKKRIPIVLLKGAFLAHTLYGDPALRPMSDIDILCREKDLNKVREALMRMGIYRQGCAQSPYHEQLFGSSRSHLPSFFDLSGKNMKLEVHVSIIPRELRNPRFMDGVWKEVSRSSLDGIPFFHLSPEHQLIHLCLHLYHHMTVSRAITLYWFCDLHEWIRNHEKALKWDIVCDRPNNFGLRPKICSMLHLMEREWHTPVPAEMLGQEGERAPLPSLAEALHFHREKKGYHRDYIGKSIRKLASARQIDGWPGRVQFLFRYIFPKRENLVFRYRLKNRYLVWFYYVYHPWKLFRRVVSGILIKYASA